MGQGEGTIPLSTAQVGMWMSHQLDPTATAGGIAEYLDIRGPVDPALWALACRAALAETDACRLRIPLTGGPPAQLIAAPTDAGPPLLEMSMEAATAWMSADLARPVDLGRGTTSFALLKVAADRFLWYQRFHHIAIDYYGIVLFTRRLAEIYTALTARQRPEPGSFGRLSEVLDESAAYRRSAEFAADRRFWTGKLAGRPAPPDLHGRGAVAGGRGVSLRRTTFLPESSLDAMDAVARLAGTSWSRLIVAAVAGYLHRMTGERDIVLGLPVAARTTPLARATPSLQANVVPLRLAVHPSATTVELAAQVSGAVREALAHQRYRYEDLRRDLGDGLFGWTVNVMSFEDDLCFGGHPATRHNLANGPVDDLSVFVFARPDGRGLQLDLTANPARYREDDLAAHERGLAGLLRAATDAPGRPLSTLDILDPVERRRVLVGFNQTRPPPAPATFPDLFRAQAARTPNAVALVHEGATVSYAQLDARADQEAERLRRNRVRPGDLVALPFDRTVAGIIGLLGIQRAGAAYLPMDTAYPRTRIDVMLRDARAAESLNAAYVIYTSGSTGVPNGVVVGHTGLASLAAAQAERFALGPGSRVLQFASPGSDAAVAEVVTTLACGAALVLAPVHRLLPGAPLSALIAEAGVTHLTLPPSVLAAVPEGGLPGVTTLVVAGEACPPDLVRRWASGRRMVNAYGPTEATVCATMSDPLTSEADIGRPLPGTQLYIVDSALQPVTIGAVGELCLAGIGLAHGYLSRPALTATRFVPNPFGPPGSRMYRTGDLARWRPDGAVEFVGRIDGQLSLRGFRIEPGEVEATLLAHPSVARAAVAVHDERLVAYVVPTAGHAVEQAALREFVADRLPVHLVPSAIVPLDRMPMTPNAKLDRRALPRPQATSTVRPPLDLLESLLCRLFAEVLGRAEVGPEDDFFALGGHSLLALRLTQRLCSILPVEVPVSMLFRAPTAAALAERLAIPGPDEEMLPIREGTGEPLFCLAPGTGSSLCYTGLRTLLPGESPIYGLQFSNTATTIGEVAGAYARRIREVQPVGPYHLLGWSFGGLAAQATACLLAESGHEVGLLAILDAYPHDVRAAALEPGEAGLSLQAIERLGRLTEGHAYQRFDGDLLFFTAAAGRAPGWPTASAWRPHLSGSIDNHDLPCGHFDMTEPEALAAIGAVVAGRLAGKAAAC